MPMPGAEVPVVVWYTATHASSLLKLWAWPSLIFFAILPLQRKAAGCVQCWFLLYRNLFGNVLKLADIINIDENAVPFANAFRRVNQCGLRLLGIRQD